MDLSSLAVSQKEFKMLVRNPATGEVVTDSNGNEMFIGILSSDTRIAKKALSEFKRTVRDEGKDISEEKLYELKCKFLAGVTTSCNLEFCGDFIEFSHDAIFDIISDQDFTWLADMLMHNIDARANFMQA